MRLLRLLAFGLPLLLPTIANAADVRVRFRVFDEAGRELGPRHLVRRMTHGHGRKVLSTGIFDLETLKALELNPGDPAHRPWIVTFSDLEQFPRQGIMVHWNTASTGYSSFLLDNGGAGFTRSGIVIFNERLALDARRQLEHSLASRPDFHPTSEFTELQERSDECFERLSDARKTRQRGAIGQRCLDLVARSMSLLMREYGIQRARTMADAKWGVTIKPEASHPLEHDQSKLDALVDLFAPQHRWARIVMTGLADEPFARAQALVNYAASHGVHLMGQLFDSTSQAKIPLSDFRARVDQALSIPDFGKIELWEVGNEVNGQWLGPEIVSKIEYAAVQAKARAPHAMRCLTFYWYSMQNTAKTSLFNWIDANMTPVIRDSVDCIALSVYVDQQPLGFSWDLIFSKLAESFPTQKIMVGEMGYRDRDGPAYFNEGPEGGSDEHAAIEYIQSRYASAFATPHSVGGGFWWYFDEQMAEKTSRWDALRSIYCAAYPELCPGPR